MASNAGVVAGWMLIALSAAAIVLNILVMWIVSKSLKREGSFNVLILNLAVFDLLLAIVGVLLRGPAMVDTDFFQLHPLLEGICKVTALLLPALSYASSLTVAMITVNRAAAIVSPHNYRSKMTFKMSIAMVVFVWVTCILFVGITTCLSATSDLLDLEFDNRAGRCSLSTTDFGETYVLAANAVFFIAPFLVTACLYVKILKEIRTRMKPTSAHNKLSNKPSSRKKIFINISLLVSLYFISWFPQFVTQILIHPGVNASVSVNVRYFTFLMFYLNLVFDPLVYTLHHNARILCCGLPLCKERSNTESMVTYNRRRSNSKSGVIIENISISNVLQN